MTQLKILQLCSSGEFGGKEYIVSSKDPKMRAKMLYTKWLEHFDCLFPNGGQWDIHYCHCLMKDLICRKQNQYEDVLETAKSYLNKFFSETKIAPIKALIMPKLMISQNEVFNYAHDTFGINKNTIYEISELEDHPYSIRIKRIYIK